MTPSTTRMTMPTTPMAYSGSGWENGITDQLSLPSISASCLRRRRTPGRAGAHLFGIERGLVDNALEQLRVDGAIGRRRHVLARFRQFGVAGNVERRSRTAHLRDPAVEIGRGHRLNDEVHPGKAV